MKKRSESESFKETWTSYHPLVRLRQEINRVFETSMQELSHGLESLKAWVPAAALYNDKDSYTLKMELPGVKKDDISVSFQGNVLTVCGKRLDESGENHEREIKNEWFFGKFQRTFELSQAVDPEGIKADYKDGVLTLLLPKTEESKQREIDIVWKEQPGKKTSSTKS